MEQHHRYLIKAVCTVEYGGGGIEINKVENTRILKE